MHPDESPTVIVPGAGATRRRRRWPAGRAAIAAALAVVLLAGVGVLMWPLFRPAAAATSGEVFLEPSGTPGRDPFTDGVVVGNPPGTKSQTPFGPTGTGVPTLAGDTPALYGGSRNEHVCDRQKLITFLGQNPDKAAAWASVLGIQTADIATYIGTLTPLQLRADTRVTNHGFADGRATTLQSVLQAGTAVLVDDTGKPRVKCGCGNPLLDPIATPVAPNYAGAPWPDFSPRSISAVSSATTRVVRFVVYDIRTGETFYRPSGTDGEADTPTTPPAVTTTPTPPPSPSPTALPCPRGTHVRASVCVSNAPVVCPSGQIRVSGRCVPPPPLTCPDGRHVSDDGTTCDPDPPNCPDGTHLGDDGTTCVDDPPPCDSGTHRADDGTCVPDQPPCPEGTHRSGGTCVDDSPVHCPPGTHPISDGTSCAPDPPPNCDNGDSGTCHGDCATGSQPDGQGSCVPDQPECPGGSALSANSTGCPGPGVGRRPGRRRRRPG